MSIIGTKFSDVTPGSMTTLTVEQALRLAIKQNSCDMVLTGDELRQCESALAAISPDRPAPAAAPPCPDAGLAERIAQLTAHRACGNQEHDAANGKLAGFCVVCQVPWPCEIAALRGGRNG